MSERDVTEGVITDTLEDVASTGTAQCLCGRSVEGDSFGEILERLYDHGVEYHDLPDDEPWTNDMIQGIKNE